jgi:hypothetical protein
MPHRVVSWSITGTVLVLVGALSLFVANGEALDLEGRP